MSMNNKYDNCCEHKFFKCIIWLTIGLIAIMLVIVVRDRYVFHNRVYDIAVSEIKDRQTPRADPVIFDSLNNRKLHTDTIKLQKTNSSSSNKENFNEISQSVTINNSDPISHIKEDIISLIDELKDTDGLIGANGITFLISLIVALLISLVSDRVIAMEDLMRQFHDLSAETMKYTKEMPQIIKLNNETQKEIQRIREINALFYIHTSNYSNTLNRVESLYNHTILIDNTISSIEVNEKTTEVIGLLGSRINLICDEIIDRFNNSKLKLDFITSEEKSLLETYIDDTLLCLQEDLKEINKKGNVALSTIIQDKIYLVEEIRDIIGTIEVREEIYT